MYVCSNGRRRLKIVCLTSLDHTTFRRVSSIIPTLSSVWWCRTRGNGETLNKCLVPVQLAERSARTYRVDKQTTTIRRRNNSRKRGAQQKVCPCDVSWERVDECTPHAMVWKESAGYETRRAARRADHKENVVLLSLLLFLH